MDNPVAEVGEVVLRLTKGSPRTQKQTLEHYFLPDASFNHPFCSVRGNRNTILSIFQWYKILSPHVDLTVNSVAFDEKNLILYVNISQVFSIFFLPFHRSPVTLTTVLQLVHGPNRNKIIEHVDGLKTRKYYIKSQNDLYQVDQFVKFFLPWGIGTSIILIWHWFATLFCIIGAKLCAPLRWNNQVIADAHPSYPDVSRTPAHRKNASNASEILELHGRGSRPMSPEVSVVSSDVSSDWEATFQRATANGDAINGLLRRRPESVHSVHSVASR